MTKRSEKTSIFFQGSCGGTIGMKIEIQSDNFVSSDFFNEVKTCCTLVKIDQLQSYITKKWKLALYFYSF